MNVLLVGGSSFIGAALGRSLAKAGHTVRGTYRSRALASEQCCWLAKGFHYELGGAIERAMFDGIDLVLYLAHDFRPGRGEATIRGTRELFVAARAMGVGRQLFVSSCSARPGARSEYGRTKYCLEEFFLAESGVVVRPGLVLGPGGLYRRMVGLLRFLPVIPLPDHGRMPVPVIDEQCLCRALEAIIAAPETTTAGREYNLLHPESVSLARLLRVSAEAVGRQPLFLPLPSRLLMLPLAVLARLGIPAPVSVDNLQGLIMNQGLALPSHLVQTVGTLPAVEAMIRAAAESVSPP